MTEPDKSVIQLWFTKPFCVEVRANSALDIPAGSVRIRSECSAISAGTEMLVYRGQLPEELALDDSIADMQDSPAYPLQYGYASVGIVETLGAGVDSTWLGKRVFCFAPHASHFVSACENLIAVPADIKAEDAVFLANMETAINLAQDGKPVLGERVVVLGQGIVGLLLTAVLARFPLENLLAVDGIAARRELARQLGATNDCAPDQIASQESDLVFEVSGAPEALNSAINLSGYGSRIVVGSWYGKKSASIELGGKAHRNRLSITTSQVSTVAPELSARWNKERRFNVAWQMLQLIKPHTLITHRLPLGEAESMYKQLHEAPEGVVQALFVYD